MAVAISLTAGHGEHPGVEIIADDPAARRLVAPLAAFLRTRPVWRGGGGLLVRVGHPRAITETFVPSTATVTVEQLESDAAITWHPASERGASATVIEG